MTEKITEKVGRPEKLTDLMKQFITGLVGDGKRKWYAPEVRTEVKLWLVKNNPRMSAAGIDERLPGDSSIRKYLKEIAPDLSKPRPGEEPWNLAKTPNLSSEAINSILAVKKVMPDAIVLPKYLSSTKARHYTVDKEGRKEVVSHPPLSVRQALWVSRLYAVKSLSKPRALMIASFVYAMTELLAEVSITDKDTSALDDIIATHTGKDLENTLNKYFEGTPASIFGSVLTAYAGLTTKDGEQ
jgi:hypothetical protein